MNSLIKQILFVFVTLICFIDSLQAQTLIGKDQIEDAFVQKTGGPIYGDLTAATSTIRAGTLDLGTPEDEHVFYIARHGSHAVIRSNFDLVLDPSNEGSAGAIIIPATVMQFPDFLGDKIRLYNNAYRIGVSAFDLDFISDKNFKFHSDTVEDLFVIAGDDGDVTAKRHITAGGDMIAGTVYKFASDSTGDKLLLYGTLYRLAVSANTVDFYSDRDFKWHTDTTANAMVLEGDDGRLTLSGPLKLPIYASLPSGNVGELIYFDHPSDDNQDGAYIYTSSGWQQL